MTDGHGHASPPRSARRWSAIIGLVIGIIGAAFVVRTLIRNWDDVSGAFSSGSVPLLLGALASAGIAMTGIGLAWHTSLRALGANLPIVSTLRGYFVGQLGKYVPGGFWAIMGRGEWARTSGVTRAVAYTSVLLSMGSAYLAALTLGAILLPLSGGLDTGRYLLVLLLLPIGFVVLHPRVLGRALRIVRQISTRDVAVEVPSWKTSVLIVLQQIPSWVLIGLVSIFIATAFGTSGDAINVIWASAIAWIVGFLALPTPGGIGVREAVFVVLASSLPAGIAATVAIVARLTFISVDAIGAGVTTIVMGGRNERSEVSG